MRSRARSLTAFAAALFVLAGFRFALWSAASLEFLIEHTLVDDAFYYLGIARNLWELGVFPTWDGTHLTNGFHPLYELLMIPLVPLVQGGTRAAYVGLILLNGALFLAGAAFLWKILERYLPAPAALLALAFVLLSSLSFKIALTGMEASLAFVLAMAFLWLVFVRDAPAWAVGAVLGLLILARLELGALYALAYFTSWCLDRRRAGLDRAAVARLGAVIAVSACFVLPYAAANYAVFGHFSTVSAAAKQNHTQHVAAQHGGRLTAARIGAEKHARMMARHTPGDALSLPYVIEARTSPEFRSEVWKTLRQHPVSTALLLGGVGLLAIGFRILMARVPPGEPERPGIGLLLFLLCVPVLHFAIVVLLISEFAQLWYWLPLLVGGAVALALLASRVPLARPVLESGLAFLAVMGLVYPITLLLATGGMNEDYRGNLWINGMHESAQFLETLPNRDEILVGSYNSGILGYVASARVVNLDGLANDWEYFDLATRGLSHQYVRDEGFTHIADFGRIAVVLQRLRLKPEQVDILFESRAGASFVLELKKN